MTLDFTDDQSTLVQVMAWCRQATSHYLSQCWPRCLSPYGVTRPQCISKLTTIGSDNGLCVTWSVPHHYLNWCWNIVNSNLVNKLQWNLKRNSNSRIFKKMHLKMSYICTLAAILSQPQCLNACCEPLWLKCNHISFNKNKNMTPSLPATPSAMPFLLTVK